MEIIDFNDSHAKAISEIVIRNLIEVNSLDYGMDDMLDMAKRFRPEDIKKLAEHRRTFTALEHGKVVGTGSLTNDFSEDPGDYWVLTVFVDPNLHGKGIGRRIMESLEVEAKALGGKHLILPSSLTSHKFYLKLGFNYIGGVAIQNDQRQYMMEKIL